MAPRQSLVASGVTLSSSPPAHKSPSAPEETEAQGRHHSPEGGRAAWSPRSTASGAGRASAHVLRENYGRPLALRPVRPQPQLLKGLPVGCSRPLDVSGLGPCKLWLSHPHKYGRDRRAGQTGTPPTCPHATRGQPSPAAAAAGPRQADARAAAWPGREAAALARTAFPWAPQATLSLPAAQPGPRCRVSRGSRSPASLTVLRRPHLWEPPQGTWDEPATAEALPAPGHSVPGSCCGPGRGSPGEAPGLSRARGALSASGEARRGRRRRQHRRREVLSRAHGPGDDQHWGQPRSPRSLQAPFKNASRQVWTQGGRKRAGPASGDARPPGPVHSLCESHDLGCVGSG